VIPQRSLEHTERVKDLNIDVFVIGDDWKGKYDYLRDLGVKVFYFPYGAGVSSSNLKSKIFQQYKELVTSADTHSHPKSDQL
jgi:choline-phosphate cytidylyltransferase/glycerol-3-phosphate cytidylyltransferase